MKKYIVKRIIQTVPVLIGISIIVFALVNLQPGDPFSTMMDPNLSLEMKAQMLERLGYNDTSPSSVFQVAYACTPG